MKPFAVILCGSGFRDGSEIRESVALLWALSTFNVAHRCFALDAPQHDVINSLTGETMAERRNQLIESARIARAAVSPLERLDPDHFSGLLFPGGFGAAKNLSDFAFKGAQGTVVPRVKTAVEAFFCARKPIGAICIAPAIVGLALAGKGLELSVGKLCDASRAIEAMGHRHIETLVSQCHIDSKNRIVTTPAYMYDDANLSELFEGIRKLVGAVMELSH